MFDFIVLAKLFLNKVSVFIVSELSGDMKVNLEAGDLLEFTLMSDLFRE